MAKKTTLLHLLFIVVVILGLLGAVLPVYAQETVDGGCSSDPDCSDCPASWSNSSLVAQGPIYDYVNNTTTIRYVVTARGKSISHVAISLGWCAWGKVTTGTTPGYTFTNPDPTTGVVGIKWDDGVNTNQTKTYTLVVKGIYEVELGGWALKGASFCPVVRGQAITILNCVVPTPTSTFTPTATNTNTPTPTETNTPTATNTFTPTPTSTFTPEPTSTYTPEPTATFTPEPTATFTPEPTSTFTPGPTSTYTPQATSTFTPEPTATFTPEPTSTFTPEPTTTGTPLGRNPLAAIGDTVWYDLNENGIQDAGESGVPAVRVNLYTGSGSFVDFAVTGPTGFYLFYDLTPGQYLVEFVLPDGYVFTTRNAGSDDTLDSDADTVTGRAIVTTLDPDEIDSTWDAGIYRPLSGNGECLECPEYVVFQSNRVNNNTDIYRARLDGSEVTRLTDSLMPDVEPIWSFDGTGIAFASKRDGNWEIYRMGPDGGTPINVTNWPLAVDGITPSSDQAPSWACEWIAFQSNRDGNWEIYKTDPDGLMQIRLTDNDAADIAPSWSPDGRWIAFQSNRDGNWELYVMDSEGNNVQRLTDNGASDRSPSWDITGDWIYFDTDREGQFDIFKLNPSTSEVVRLTDDPADDTDPDAAPYCEYVFFETQREGQPQVYRMLTDGSQQQSVILGDNGPVFWNDNLDEVTDLLGYLPIEEGKTVRLPIIIK